MAIQRILQAVAQGAAGVLLSTGLLIMAFSSARAQQEPAPAPETEASPASRPETPNIQEIIRKFAEK